MTAEHPGAPVATAPPQFDPSAQTTEMESVPGQRGAPCRTTSTPGPGATARAASAARTAWPAVPAGRPPPSASKKGLLITGAVVVVLAAAAGGAYVYSQGQYYVTPSSDSKQVLLYQGLSQLSFASSQQSMSDGPLWISSVPQSKRADLYKTESFGSKDAALAYLEQYRTAAKSCADYRHSQPADPAGAAPGAGASRQATLPGQNLAPSAPAASSKAGAPLANGPASDRTRTRRPASPPARPPRSAASRGRRSRRIPPRRPRRPRRSQVTTRR